MEQVLKKEKQIQAKPIMKWAGGKTQMLGDIMPKIPRKYGKYIEPFIGGGALFFALSPDKAIIADSNPELINMYRQVADNVEVVISYLKKYKNTKEDFYEVRSLDWLKLKKEEAAARTLYLNKTCFNGLYRVNKKGQFNVPFGKYKSPNFCDEEALYAASEVLKKATITCGDYLSVLKEYAEPGDFVFLDPPYLPISEYSDFKRYTKEQFYEEDHSTFHVLQLLSCQSYVLMELVFYEHANPKYYPRSLQLNNSDWLYVPIMQTLFLQSLSFLFASLTPT